MFQSTKFLFILLKSVLEPTKCFVPLAKKISWTHKTFCFVYKKNLLWQPNILVGSTKRFNIKNWLTLQNRFVASIATKKFGWDNQTFFWPTKHFSQCVVKCTDTRFKIKKPHVDINLDIDYIEINLATEI